MNQPLRDIEARIGAEMEPLVAALSDALKPYSPSVAGYRDGQPFETIGDPATSRAAFIYEHVYHDMIKTSGTARMLLKGANHYGNLSPQTRLENAIGTLDTASKGAFTAQQLGVEDATLSGAIEAMRTGMKDTLAQLREIPIPQSDIGAER